MKLADSWTNYNLFFHELTSKNSELIFEDDKVEVHTIPLNHRVYTNGYLFKEKENERKLNINAAEDAEIDVAYYRKLKKGFDVVNEKGDLIKNETVTWQGQPSKSYAFCSDTMYKEDIVPVIKQVSVLYHESTFLEKHANLAKKTKHSTAKQAANIAKKAQADVLLLGHYSTRYGDLQAFKNEAKEIFENVELCNDGKVFEF